MSTARKAREWLAAQGGPRTSRQIADAIGGDPVKIQWAVGTMLRDGLMGRVSALKPCTYVVLRDGMTAAQASVLATQVRRDRAESKAAVREQERAAAAYARQIERHRVSLERKRARAIAKNEKRRADRAAKLAGPKPVADSLQPTHYVPVGAQTVEEFMAMGGHVERLETSFRPRGVPQ